MTTGRVRSVAPTIPYAFIHAVNEATITTTPTALEWDHAHFINSSLRFTDNTTRVYINRGAEGIYEIDASCGMDNSGGAPSHGVIVLYINGVAGICCEAHCYISPQGGTHGDCFLHTTQYLRVGDYVEVYAHVNAGTAAVETNTARLHLKGIELKGWDNRHGGSNKYPFRQE